MDIVDKQIQNDRIKRIAQNVLNLPALPTIVATMIELIDDPRTSASRLTRLISADQVLTAKILKMANSAYYGFPQKIGTVNLAIVVLGFDMVRDLGLSSTIVSKFKTRDVVSDFDMSRFWEHSISVGVVGKALAKDNNLSQTGEIFVAGLLHDIGKLVLNQYFAKEFDEIIKRVKENNESFRQAELEVLGLGHGTIGGWLGEKWKMPGQLVECIQYHHTPADAAINPKFTAIIHFADYLCKWKKIGYSGDVKIPRLSLAALNHLNIKMHEDEIDKHYYSELIQNEVGNAETFINLIQGRSVPQNEFE